MYTAFGNKHGPFRLSLNNYLQRTLHERVCRPEATAKPGLAITTFFDEIIERSLGDKLQRGCMLVNSIFESSFSDRPRNPGSSTISSSHTRERRTSSK
jgi:TetR/AcrR family transcriptional repressor of nem operon